MKKIMISDITLRNETSNTGFSLSFKEKIELAKELDKLGADVIEIAPVTEAKTNSLLARTIAPLLKDSILACPVGLTKKSIEDTWNSIMQAAHPRLQVSIPVSSVQMEFVCRQKPTQILDTISELVEICASFCADVEFAAEDATRSDGEFLAMAIERAISAGAKTITICDSAGNMMPEEFCAYIRWLYKKAPALGSVSLSVQCGNEIGMAAACAFTSVSAGAEQIKTSASGASYPSLELIAQVFKTRGDSMDISCNLDLTRLRRSLGRMVWLIDTERSIGSPFDNEVGKSSLPEDFLLDENADVSKVSEAVSKLGYDLSSEDLSKVYDAFSQIASKKKVGVRELETIVASSALQVAPTYKLVNYVINSGNTITATANIQLEKDGKALTGLSIGDGPIDASLLAIEQIIGHHYELDDFQIQAVTEGREAMGSALVKLRSGGKLFSGQGISTDIIGASIRAYLDALNKIVYEEKLK